MNTQLCTSQHLALSSNRRGTVSSFHSQIHFHGLILCQLLWPITSSSPRRNESSTKHRSLNTLEFWYFEPGSTFLLTRPEQNFLLSIKNSSAYKEKPTGLLFLTPAEHPAKLTYNSLELLFSESHVLLHNAIVLVKGGVEDEGVICVQRIVGTILLKSARKSA